MGTPEIEIVGTLEKRSGSTVAKIHEHKIRRSPHAAGLLLELEDYWRVMRQLAEHRQCMPALYFYSHDRARCVAIRIPAFEPSERRERDCAKSIIEALRKLSPA